MPISTIFSGFNQPVENKSLVSIFNDIQGGKYRADIEIIRSLIGSGDVEKADQLKRQLPAFTPSATFKGGRKAEFIDQYSGVVHLDFDKLETAQLESAFQAIIRLSYTLACFRSPGGQGLKVFIEVNASGGLHETVYKQVQAYYEKALGITCDHKCKDVTRLCFVSYDPDLYINYKNLKFDYQAVSIVNDSTAKSGTRNYQSLFEECIRFTEQKEKYQDGNRNNFVYLLACNCNRIGIPKSIAQAFISNNYDLSEDEITSSVNSAYVHHTREFANFAKFAINQPEDDGTASHQELIEEDYLKNTPIISDLIYDQLPDLLKAGSLAFSNPRERDVFLTGALAILSGCMPNVQGVYAQQTVFPNLYSFIIAPAASGKGALRFSKCLADRHHDHLLTASKEAQQQFNAEMNEYKANQRSKKKHDPADEPPVQPLFKVLYIPANSSYAKILWHLEQNSGAGIICETEADTMANVLKQEWGSYSDMLRKGFHHERLSSSKKTNNEYIEVNEPRLSVALSGTPSQVTGLISSSQDGLFSRFMFYAFKVDQLWHDVSPYACEYNRTDHFKSLSDYVFELISFLNQYPTVVELSQSQWKKLNEICSRLLSDVTIFSGDEAGSIVKRLGLILYRMSMIFTVLRKYENGDTSLNITCTDADFNLAVQLSDLYLQHSILMYHNLPKEEENAPFRSGANKRKFFDSLPQEFNRAEAVELGKQFNLKSRSVDGLLQALKGRYLSQPNSGHYIKL